MKKVLFISNNIYPLTAGDSLYNWGIAKAIDEITDMSIYSYAYSRDDVDKCDLDINGDMHLYVLEDSLAKKTRRNSKIAGIYDVDRKMYNDICFRLEAEKYDFVLVSHIVMGQFAELLKKKYENTKIIYLSHDVEVINLKLYERYMGELKKRNVIKSIARKIVRGIEIQMHKKYEKMLLCDMDGYFTISRADAIVHKKIYGKKIRKSYFAKPLIEFETVKSVADLKHFNKKLMIVGTMSWFPNIEGTVWFVENVFSNLVSDGYILYIVGNKPADKIVQLHEKYPDNVVVTGRVESVKDYFEICDISIVPLFTGTGAKIKVLESIASGIPTVCSSFAAKDYDIDGEILIADTPEEFLNSIRTIAENEEVRTDLYKKMKDYYREYMKLDDEIIKLLS